MKRKGKRPTREALDVGEEDGDLLVSVDVDLVELVGLELARRPLLLLRDVADHLLCHEARKDCGVWNICGTWNRNGKAVCPHLTGADAPAFRSPSAS